MMGLEQMYECLIFNTDRDYVRTRNFVKYTKDLFEHDFSDISIKTPLINQVIKFCKIYSIRKKGHLVYIPNFDPILIKFCNLFNIKVISDILEPHPEMHYNSFLKRNFYKMLERDTVKKSYVLITVTEEETNNLRKKYKAKNIFTIRNFPDLDDFKQSKKKFERFSIVYFGIFALSRDLTNATKAISKLQEKHNIDFYVIGDKKLLSQVFCKCKYLGWLNHKQASKLISKCHIGIAPYNDNSHCNLTLQNKAFQYAACNALPISTNLKPLQRYSQLIRLVPKNSVENWYKEIEKIYKIWRNKKLKFNQREILINNKWTAEDEWGKLNKFLKAKQK